MANSTNTTRKATPNDAKKESEKKSTFTKAGPHSKSGGQGRGKNGVSRPFIQSGALRQVQEDARRAVQDAAEMFQYRWMAIAAEMLASETKFNGKPVNDDVRLGAMALIDNFRDARAVYKEDDKGRRLKGENGRFIIETTRTTVAENFAAMQFASDAIALDEARLADIDAGFRLAKRLLPRAYDTAKAEQAS